MPAISAPVLSVEAASDYLERIDRAQRRLAAVRTAVVTMGLFLGVMSTSRILGGPSTPRSRRG